jgi:hypothetical protein
MVGYSYFDYDQMTLLGIEVHSDELELLQQVVDTYTLLYVPVRMSWMKICRRVFPFWMRWRKLK